MVSAFQQHDHTAALLAGQSLKRRNCTPCIMATPRSRSSWREDRPVWPCTCARASKRLQPNIKPVMRVSFTHVCALVCLCVGMSVRGLYVCALGLAAGSATEEDLLTARKSQITISHSLWFSKWCQQSLFEMCVAPHPSLPNIPGAGCKKRLE